MHSAMVVGTGLMGTSVALALSSHGVTVHLRDIDPVATQTATALGAGTIQDPVHAVDLAIVAVPPPVVGDVLAGVQAEGIARHYTDIASVKSEPQRSASDLACDLSRYIGGHPMAGSSRSGPLAVRADLFEGRTWVLTPTPETGTETLNTALELVSICGGVPVVMQASAHDRAVALVSHAPHLVASLMAMQLEHAADREVSLAGPGLRDHTRIAEADPRLWLEILSANAAAVADLLDDVGDDLRRVVTGLRDLARIEPEHRSRGAGLVADVLHRGRAGRARISDQNGSGSERLEVVCVVIGAQHGELARLFADVTGAGLDIEDVSIEHSAGQVHLSVAPGLSGRLRETLRDTGWPEK